MPVDHGPQRVYAEDGVSHCACGCGESLDGKREGARFASDGCRTRAWREARVSPAERRRTAQRAAKREARAQGPIASDTRLSFGRAQRVLAAYIAAEQRVAPEIADMKARHVLREALPARLRDAA